MLNQVSKSLKKEELEQMKFMCADKIPKRKLEEIETPQALWEQLMEKELIGPLKPELIGHLLVQIERQDLVNDWEYMRRNGIDGHSYQGILFITINLNDRLHEFSYCSVFDLQRSYTGCNIVV